MKIQWTGWAVACCVLGMAAPASAQTSWTGGYLGVDAGIARLRLPDSATILFDKNLDGQFDDTVLTGAGANAFSPGFCSGAASTALPADGCARDESGASFGGRAGYDWQMGSLVFGVAGDVASVDLVDSVSAFSTTPAFYTMTRELNMLSGFRARIGAGTSRALIYGTAGAAYATLEHRFTTSNAVNTFVESEDADNVWGYQAGAGAEFRVVDRLSVGVEYLYTNLDERDDYTVRAQGPAPLTNPFILTNASGTDFTRSDVMNIHAIRVNASLRF